MNTTEFNLQIIPELPSLDFDETLNFWQSFEIKPVARHADLLVLSWHGQRLHYWLCDQPVVCQNASVYILTDQIDHLWSTFSGKHCVRLPLQNRSWGMREFVVEDPHGCLWKFGKKLLRNPAAQPDAQPDE